MIAVNDPHKDPLREGRVHDLASHFNCGTW